MKDDQLALRDVAQLLGGTIWLQTKQTFALVKYDIARRALAEAKRIGEVKSIRDKAAAMQHYAKQAKDRQLINDATDIRLRAERRAGELLAQMDKNKGARGNPKGRGAKIVRSSDATAHPRLSDLGVSKTQSSRWQRFADLPQTKFEAHVAKATRLAMATIEGDKELLRKVRAQEAEERRAARFEKFRQINKGNRKLPTAIKYPIILADPAWYFKVYTSEAAYKRTPDYPTMKLAELCALPVRDLATKDAMLFLWAPSTHLREAFDVIEAWGFQYATCAVWVKTDCAPGLGHYVRQQHEFLLIARRGNFPPPPPNTRPSSVITAPRREHSRKPDEVHAMIERMYPDVPKIELFARRTRKGWASWGNQAQVAA
jgi:N6-adenosine-specific RNA methylase IME4